METKLTPIQRHQIIRDKLKEYNKSDIVFHSKWNRKDLLDGKILTQTLPFWYMRYSWTRPEIEGLFYAAQVYINPQFESGLDESFGHGSKSTIPRWLPPEMRQDTHYKWDIKTASHSINQHHLNSAPKNNINNKNNNKNTNPNSKKDDSNSKHTTITESPQLKKQAQRTKVNNCGNKPDIDLENKNNYINSLNFDVKVNESDVGLGIEELKPRIYKNDFKVAVAIDFGTDGTAISFCDLQNNKFINYVNVNWDGDANNSAQTNSMKKRTCLLLENKENGKCIAFGDVAQEMYLQECDIDNDPDIASPDDTSMFDLASARGVESKYLFFDHFKMALYS